MSACEECWTEASRRAARSHESTAEIYARLVTEGCHAETPSTTDSEEDR